MRADCSIKSGTFPKVPGLKKYRTRIRPVFISNLALLEMFRYNSAMRKPFLALFFIIFSAVPASASSEAARVIAAVNQRYETVRTLTAFVEIDIQNQGGQAGKQAQGQIAVNRQNGEFYFKTFNPLQPEFFTLVAAGKNFWLRSPEAKTIYTGDLETLNAGAIQLKITPADFQKMLFGEKLDLSKSITLEENGRFWLIQQKEPAHHDYVFRELVVDKAGLNVLKETRFLPDGKAFLTIEWQQFHNGGMPANAVLGTRVFYHKELTGEKVNLRLKRWNTNAPLSQTLFRPLTGRGYRLEEI